MGISQTIRPIPVAEIEELEKLYNHGSLFPQALRELLYLAGADCYVLDYGLNETQKEMQEAAQEWLDDSGKAISRPFYVIDVYNARDQFLYIYLDEGEDPVIYSAFLSDRSGVATFTALEFKLSAFINMKIEAVKMGRNPF